MLSDTILFVILAIQCAIIIYAVGAPISKSPLGAQGSKLEDTDHAERT